MQSLITDDILLCIYDCTYVPVFVCARLCTAALRHNVRYHVCVLRVDCQRG